MLTIYLSYPCSHNQEDDLHYSDKLRRFLSSCGMAVFNSLANDYNDTFSTSDLQFLKTMDVVFFAPGWEKNEKCKIEFENAQRMNKPIFCDVEILFRHFKQFDIEKMVSEV